MNSGTVALVDGVQHIVVTLRGLFEEGIDGSVIVLCVDISEDADMCVKQLDLGELIALI